MPILGKGGDFENEAIDIDALEGDARAYPEGDENFPELWNVQRATFMQIMDTPQGQQLLTEPDNAELAVKLIGIPNLVLPGADSRRQAMRIIGMLTEPQETVQPDGSTTNMAAVANPEQLAGLIDPDDDPAAMYATMNHWRLSDAGMKCQKENPTGYANVRALMALQKAQIPPPPPPVKPLSVTSTIAVDKMPPEAQAIILKKEYGVDLTPQDFLNQALLEKEKKSKAPTLPTPGQPITGNQVQPGAGVANG
jgi:hypothetical protein